MKKKQENPKTFVLDTSVIIHDSSCIKNFAEHDIKIPLCVIEELDNFKKGQNDAKAFHARDLTRTLDKMDSEHLFDGGVSLGQGKGKLSVETNVDLHELVKAKFSADIIDHRIISVALRYKEEHPEREVILVTKDTNLRLKARSLKIKAEDYESDQLKEIDKLYKGKIMIEDSSLSKIINLIYKDGKAPYSMIKTSLNFQPIHNMYVILRDPTPATNNSALARVDIEQQYLVRVEKKTVSGITPRNAEQVFAVDAVLNPNTSLVTLYGKAGTGKTLLAIAAALELLKEKRCKQIIISAALVPVGNKDVGFLPGDLNEKVSPYMQGLFDNVAFIKTQIGKKGATEVEKYFVIKEKANDDGPSIVIQPLNTIRGRSINNTVFVLDESQNTTPHEAKTAITRAGENTKMILCGDIEQIDAPYLGKSDNGLAHVVYKFKGRVMSANVYLEKGERSALATLASEIL